MKTVWHHPVFFAILTVHQVLIEFVELFLSFFLTEVHKAICVDSDHFATLVIIVALVEIVDYI